MRRITFATALCLAAMLATQAAAANELGWQGRVLDASGEPITGNLSLSFSIYTDSTGGTALWSEMHPSVMAENGLVSVQLGSVTPFPDELFSHPVLYLGVEVESDGEMSPRTELTSSGQAFHAATVTGFSPGKGNVVTGEYVLVSGDSNSVLSDYSTVAGGLKNTVEVMNVVDTVLDTTGLLTSGPFPLESRALPTSPDQLNVSSFLGGGFANNAGGIWSVVVGGAYNNAWCGLSAIVGGYNNLTSGSYGFIGGGYRNRIGTYPNCGCGGLSVIGGGGYNYTEGRYSVIGGGIANQMTDCAVGKTIGGGYYNVAEQHLSTVGGGYRNTANGRSTTVGGGEANQAINPFATVGGGRSNVTSGQFAAIAGGESNDATADYATIAGGQRNAATSDHSTVGGGDTNTAMGTYATIGGGSGNQAIGTATTIGGGDDNIAQFGNYQTIGGGQQNVAQNDFSTVGGGTFNRAVIWATVAGGVENDANNEYAFIGGGLFNQVTGHAGVIGGGKTNVVQTWAGTIGGGEQHQVLGPHGTIGGGRGNAVLGDTAFVGGGSVNVAEAVNSTIGGGFSNRVAQPATYGIIGGGFGNGVIGFAGTVGGGEQNQAGPGAHATVPGGLNSQASGKQSFASGTVARAVDSCSWVWSDCCVIPGTVIDAPMYSFGPNTFNARATGGYYLLTSCDTIFDAAAPPPGVHLPPGGSQWLAGSDSTMKQNIRPVSDNEVLEAVTTLPIYKWSYKAQDPSIEHIGPMAQDFYRVFEVGDNDRTIAQLDPSGVALAAIKALAERTKEIDRLKSELAETKQSLEQLTAQVGALAAQVKAQSGQTGSSNELAQAEQE